MLRFGISFASHPDCVDLVRQAEAVGYDAAWYYDSPALGSDPFVILALTAQATSTIDLGLGVAVPALRLPHVLATAVGTLNVYAPGRLRLGLGTGFTGALSIGARPTPWSLMAETSRLVRNWLNDENAEMTVDGITRQVRHLHPNRGHLNTSSPVPLYISATGPRGQRVATDVGDGLWTISVDRRPTPEWLASDVTPAVERAHAAGHTDFPVALLTAAAVQQEGEPLDSDRLRSFIGPWITTYLHSAFPIFANHPFDPDSATGTSALSGPAEGDDLLAKARQEYFESVIHHLPDDAPWLSQHTGHSIFVRPEEQEFITAELIEHLALVGPAERLLTEIAALEAGGLTELVWQVIPGHEDEIETFARQVIAPYRARAGA